MIGCFIYSATYYLALQIMMQNVTRLCQTRSVVTVNGKFPGPRIVVREGDRVVVKVINHVQNNITVHWYGLHIKSGLSVDEMDNELFI